MKVPGGGSAAVRRIAGNIDKYQSNYLVLTVIVATLCLLVERWGGASSFKRGVRPIIVGAFPDITNRVLMIYFTNSSHLHYTLLTSHPQYTIPFQPYHSHPHINSHILHSSNPIHPSPLPVTPTPYLTPHPIISSPPFTTTPHPVHHLASS